MLFIDVLVLTFALISSLWILLQSLYYTETPLKCEGHTSSNRKASIIVAIKDEPPKVIEELIENLSNLNYEDYEVIIVSDDSEEAFNLLPKVYPANFRLIRRDKPLGRKAGALNFASNIAKGDFLVYLDSEARVDRDFLKGVSHHLSSSDAVSLRLKVRSPLNKLQKLYAEMTEFSMNSLFRGRFIRNLPIFPNGSAFAITRDALNRIGGWKENKVAEDLEIGIRMYLKGLRVSYADDVLVTTLAPYSWRDFFEQMKRWAYGSGELFPYSLSMIRKGIRGIEGTLYANQWGIYPLLLVGLLVLGLLSGLLRSSPFYWLASLSTFLVITFVFSLRSKTREYDMRIPALTISAFSVGYFSGLIRLKFKWKVTPKIVNSIKDVDSDWIPIEANVLSFLFFVSGLVSLSNQPFQAIILFIISILLLIIP
ncbi:MAG: glycosyltransferase family 2 protein [Metallosphaera sp.]